MNCVSVPEAADALGGHAQHLRRDLRERRALALAHLRRADQHDRLAVGLEPHDRAADRVRAGRQQAHREPASVPAVARLVPAERRGDLLDVARRGPRRAACRRGRTCLAGPQQVAPAHLQRVEARRGGRPRPPGARRPTGGARRRRRGTSPTARCSCGRRRRATRTAVPAIGPGRGVAAGRDHARARCRRRRRCRSRRRRRAPAAGRRASAAVRIGCVAPWRRVVAIDSSTRLTMRTGRPALRASATVMGSIFVYDLLPKPPPRYGTMTRTRAERQAEQVGDLGTHQERVLAGRPERDAAGLRLRRRPSGSPSRTGRRPGTCSRPRPRSSAAANDAVDVAVGRARSDSRRCRRARRRACPARGRDPGGSAPRGRAARRGRAPRAMVPTTGQLLVLDRRWPRRRPPRWPRRSPRPPRPARPTWRTRSMATMGRSLMAWPQ